MRVLGSLKYGPTSLLSTRLNLLQFLVILFVSRPCPPSIRTINFILPLSSFRKTRYIYINLGKNLRECIGMLSQSLEESQGVHGIERRNCNCLFIQFVPKPSKANRFCLICKETYEDYLTVFIF